LMGEEESEKPKPKGVHKGTAFLKRKHYDEEKHGPLRTILKNRKTIEKTKTKLYGQRLQQPPKAKKGLPKFKVWKHAVNFSSANRLKERRLREQWRARRQEGAKRFRIQVGKAEQPETKPELVLFVRLVDDSLLPAGIRKRFEQLRLVAKNHAVFLKMDAKLASDLRELEPYRSAITPTEADVLRLLTSYGYCQYKNNSYPLSNNIMVEDVLGKHEILCVSDIASHLSSLGPHFDEVAAFISPIKLEEATVERVGKQRTLLLKRCRVEDTLVAHLEHSMGSADLPKKSKRQRPAEKAEVAQSQPAAAATE